jgi:hypothetical protein
VTDVLRPSQKPGRQKGEYSRDIRDRRKIHWFINISADGGVEAETPDEKKPQDSRRNPAALSLRIIFA